MAELEPSAETWTLTAKLVKRLEVAQQLCSRFLWLKIRNEEIWRGTN